MSNAEMLRQLAERVAQLENRMDKLTSIWMQQIEKPGWQGIVGTFKDDKVFAEIVRLGRQIRRADRASSHGKASQNPNGKQGRSKRRAKQKEDS